MDSDHWIARCQQLLLRREQAALLRRRQVVHPIDATHVEIDGVRYVNFCSNNYLGLTHHPKTLAALVAAGPCGVGSGAAGLITGYAQTHQSCESALAQWKGTEAAILLPSGYQANLAAIQTLAAIGNETFPGGARFLVDKLVHASLIDAVRATQSPMRVFPHNGMAKLNRLLEAADVQQLQIVVTESIFSMDGDRAELEQICQLKRSYPFALLLDEAHASGVYGPSGRGLAAEMGLQDSVDVSIVTLSKALGCIGGAVCATKVFCDALLNYGRSYIYSTSVPPTVARCAQAAIQVIQREPERQQRVRQISTMVREQLARVGIGAIPGDSPIIPVVLGDESRALGASEQLKERALLVATVRPPTVPKGSSRLRLTLAFDHTDEEIERLIREMSQLC